MALFVHFLAPFPFSLGSRFEVPPERREDAVAFVIPEGTTLPVYDDASAPEEVDVQLPAPFNIDIPVIIEPGWTELVKAPASVRAPIYSVDRAGAAALFPDLFGS